ncbi:MAG TPA: vanadium-dependent haloperoxidase [Roseiflexaceae bacterium]|nr:vanadium-dependent haloperoxidase [Roseiflexaceae bacterium]
MDEGHPTQPTQDNAQTGTTATDHGGTDQRRVPKREKLNRRSFFGRVSSLTAATLAAGAGLSIDLAPLPATTDSAAAEELGPVQGAGRAARAQQIRVDAATFQRNLPLASHPDNGDEQSYAGQNYFASYTKGLPHDSAGLVTPAAYQALRTALNSGNPADFEAIPLGTSGGRRLANPQAAYAYALEGADSHALGVRAAPAFASLEASGEMEELYWMSLVRDVPFADFGSNPLIAAAGNRLSLLSDYRGAKDANGIVSPATVFRDESTATLPGPFISQFLLLDVPIGGQNLTQQTLYRPAGDDHMVTFQQWLNIQNGVVPTTTPSPGRRYITTPRDLAEYVHLDPPVQPVLNAALIVARLLGGLDPAASPPGHDPNNPYRTYTRQGPFITFGNADIQALLGLVANLALRAQWYQKWLVHRRLRPEEFGGRVHTTKSGGPSFPVNSELLNSAVLNQVRTRNDALDGSGTGTYLLSQAYPEGSPTHPSYGSGHSVYIGAGVTLLKAFYKVDTTISSPVQPSADGSTLVGYTGSALRIDDELDKLAMNVGIGRLFAGIHYRSDHATALRQGELVAIRVLQDWLRLYNEPFSGFELRTFGGTTVTVTATEPFTNAVSSIESLSFNNGTTLYNGSQLVPGRAIRANTYPAAVGSVAFRLRYLLTGETTTVIENSAPYNLTVSTGRGPVLITATPYSKANATGIGGIPLTIGLRDA